MGASNSAAAAGAALPGFRILAVSPDSPLNAAAVEPFFDSIVEVNDVNFAEMKDLHIHDFGQLVQSCEDRTVPMVLFNSRTQRVRKIDVSLRRSPKDPNAGLLGAAVRLVDNVLETPAGVRILKVFENSPAAAAELRAETDFILGLPGRDFQTYNEFLAVIADTAAEGAPFPIVVLDAETGRQRQVALHPRADWGGEGLLGCELAAAAFHRMALPADPSAPAASSSSDEEEEDEEGRSGRKAADKAAGKAAADEEDEDESADSAERSPSKVKLEALAIRELLLQRQAQRDACVDDFLPCMAEEVLYPVPGQLFLLVDT